MDGRDENVVLEFRPNPAHDMLIACLWSRWTAAGEPDLLSFAAITDEPPSEIAATGHDRCIVPIKPENIDSCLKPNASDLAARQRCVLFLMKGAVRVHSAISRQELLPAIFEEMDGLVLKCKPVQGKCDTNAIRRRTTKVAI
jgi:putative SOS response-associated peptidase YedK